MRVEDRLDPGRRPLLGEVLRRQAAEGAHEGGGVPRQVDGEAIGAPLVRSRQRVGQRRDGQRHRPGRECDDRQAGHVGGTAQAERAREPLERTVGGIEAGGYDERLQREPRPEIAVHVVRQLVREDHFDLVVGVGLEQRVRQQDAAGATDADERGVGLAGTVTKAPLEDAAHRRPRLPRQRDEPRRERRTVERPEVVEDRKQPHRGGPDHRDEQRGKQHGRREPPPLRAHRNQRRHQQRRRYGQHAADHHRLEVGQPPVRAALRRQSVAPLERDAAVIRERERQQFVKGEDDRGKGRSHREPRKPEGGFQHPDQRAAGAADDQEDEKQNPDRSGGERSAALQPVVQRRLVFVRHRAVRTRRVWGRGARGARAGLAPRPHRRCRAAPRGCHRWWSAA